MHTRLQGPWAGFGWLKRAIQAVFARPRAIFGGAALLIVMSLLPSLLTVPLQLGQLGTGQPSLGNMGAAMAISLGAGLFLVPLVAGYMRVIDASERGRPVSAREVFAPYRDGQTLRLMGYGLAMLALYVMLLVLVVAATGGALGHWYLQALTAQPEAPETTELPAHFGLALLLFGVGALLMGAVYAISLGQVALGGRSVAGALRDGLVGACKNVLPLLVLAVCAMVAWLLLALVLVLLVGLAALLAKLVGAWVLLLLAIPLYLALVLVATAIMYATAYHLWRDVCGEPPGTNTIAASVAA